MSEDLRKVILSPRDRRMLTGLSDVARDLWGTNSTSEPNGEAAVGCAASDKVEAANPVGIPSNEKIWETADEPVDWTDALTYSSSPDGLTSQKDWDFYHSVAAKVLSGDIDSYVKVLSRMKPLDDLVPYAASFEITVSSPDTLKVKFCPKAHFTPENISGYAQYVCGVALRVCRDLMALLPVNDVQVQVLAESFPDAELVSVRFDRKSLQNVRFSFTDPVELVKSSGGKIHIS